jgi:transcription elongation factor Elf1
MNNRRLEEKPACSVKSAPMPEEVQCPHCGIEIEMWSDETDISCKLCGKLVRHDINLSHQEDT